METLPTVYGHRAAKHDDDHRKVEQRFDRRRSRRRRVFKGAAVHWATLHLTTPIIHLRKWPTFHCVVLNLSEGGACLEVRDPLPNSFVLVLDDVFRTCRVVWRRSNRIGVEFLK